MLKIIGVAVIATQVGRAVPVDGDDAPSLDGPIQTVNAVVGDASFVARFGRPPRASDAETLRIQTHLEWVARELRRTTPRDLPPDLARKRRINLDRLAEYRRQARFPRGDAPAGRVPTFIDRDGRLCAVGYLVARSAGERLARAIDDRFHHGYVADIARRSTAFAAWRATSGLTDRELAMIQPTYEYHPPPRARIAFALGYDYLLDSATEVHSLVDGTSNLWLVRTRGQHESLIGLETTVGWANPAELVYRVHGYLGVNTLSPPDWAPGNVIGLRVGAGADGITDTLPVAVTLPAEVFVNFWWLELRAGVEWAAAGDDRPLAWQLVARVIEENRPGLPGAYVDLSLGHLADSFMIGASVGFSPPRKDGYADWRAFP